MRGRRAAGVVAHDPQHAQRGHRTGRDVIVEVLQPQIDAELVRNAQIELREVLDQVVVHGRDRGLCLDRVLEVERRLALGSRRSAIGPPSKHCESA